jgi:hypothetical protein
MSDQFYVADYKLHDLCSKMDNERDPKKSSALIEDLFELLSNRHTNMSPKTQAKISESLAGPSAPNSGDD